jgi:hypothetical protein
VQYKARIAIDRSTSFGTFDVSWAYFTVSAPSLMYPKVKTTVLEAINMEQHYQEPVLLNPRSFS